MKTSRSEHQGCLTLKWVVSQHTAVDNKHDIKNNAVVIPHIHVQYDDIIL